MPQQRARQLLGSPLQNHRSALARQRASGPRPGSRVARLTISPVFAASSAKAKGLLIMPIPTSRKRPRTVALAHSRWRTEPEGPALRARHLRKLAAVRTRRSDAGDKKVIGPVGTQADQRRIGARRLKRDVPTSSRSSPIRARPSSRVSTSWIARGPSMRMVVPAPSTGSNRPA